MNGVNPKWVFYLGILVTIETAIGQGTVKLTSLVPDPWIPLITGWCTLLAFAGNVIMTALAGYSSKAMGPLIKPIVLLAVVVLGSLFACTGDAHAQARKRLTGNIVNDIAAATRPAATTPTNSLDNAFADFNAKVQTITKEIVDKAITDVTAAQADAQNHNDQIAKPCWDANLALLKSLPTQWESPPTSIGLALGMQIQRDLLNSITGSDVSSLKVACAALWGDQLKILTNAAALIGVKISTAGLL